MAYSRASIKKSPPLWNIYIYIWMEYIYIYIYIYIFQGGGHFFKIDIRYILGVHKFRANILATCKSIIPVHSGVIIFFKILFIGFLTFFFFNLYFLVQTTFFDHLQ